MASQIIPCALIQDIHFDETTKPVEPTGVVGSPFRSFANQRHGLSVPWLTLTLGGKMGSIEDDINKKVYGRIKAASSTPSEWQSCHLQTKELIQHLATDHRASSVTISNYAAILSNLGQHEEAVTILEKLLTRAPNFREAYFNLAAALMNTTPDGRKKAQEYFRKASEHKPGDYAIEAYLDPHAH